MSLTRPNPNRPEPSPTPPAHQGCDRLTEAEAEAYVRGICFKTGPPRQVGVELEWLVNEAHDPTLPVTPQRLTEALAGLTIQASAANPGPTQIKAATQPHLSTANPVPPSATPTTPLALGAPTDGPRLPQGGLLTREPGGQVELSSLPAESLMSCIAAVRRDLAALRAALERHDLLLSGYGHDPWRRPGRTLELPRYAAMEEYFDRRGPAGRSMMCATASVQVCLDAGTEDLGPTGFVRRWHLAHLLGPILVAAFANSPLVGGRPSGWRSTRQAVWSKIDPGRTLAPRGAQPRDAWAAYALDAGVMCVRQTGAGPWTAPASGITFRRWINGEYPTGRGPTIDDLDYHLTTLFPPVRPQGHLELRMIDAQPGEDGWLVPLAVTAALFEDPQAAQEAEDAARHLDTSGAPAPRNRLWLRAARHALTDPELHSAARVCFAAAIAALRRLGATEPVCAAVADFADRYVQRRRCPADDLLDAQLGFGSDPSARTPPFSRSPRLPGRQSELGR